MKRIRCGVDVLWLSLAAASLALGQQKPSLTPAEARKIIAEGNVAWGKARVALDRAAFEQTLAPDFYVQMQDNKKISRQEFLDMISVNPQGGKLVRFDASVLTVEPLPSADGWVATIQEKLEFERADGKPRTYSLWITRDTWKKVGGRWVVTSSEAIGDEFWRNGEKPPFRDW